MLNITLEINPVPSGIANNVLKQSVCQALLLTGISVKPDDVQVCHQRRTDLLVNLNVKSRHNVLSNSKTLQKNS